MPMNSKTMHYLMQIINFLSRIDTIAYITMSADTPRSTLAYFLEYDILTRKIHF